MLARQYFCDVKHESYTIEVEDGVLYLTKRNKDIFNPPIILHPRELFTLILGDINFKIGVAIDYLQKQCKKKNNSTARLQQFRSQDNFFGMAKKEFTVPTVQHRNHIKPQKRQNSVKIKLIRRKNRRKTPT